MFISVIIPTYNRVETLKKCLDKITNQNIRNDQFEVIIVDDFSQDNTQEFCRSFLNTKNNVSYIRNEINEGRVITRNKGIKNSKGALIVFLDNDLMVENNFLQCHLNYYKNNSQKIAVVSNVTYQPKVLETTNFGTFIQSRAIGYRSKRDMVGISLNNLPSNFFAGGGSSCEKKHIIEIGMFDENLSKYGSEDELFGFKLNSIGIKIKFCESARIIHDDINIHPQYWKIKYIEQGRYGLRTIAQNEYEMIDESMFRYLIPINSKVDNFRTIIIKKIIAVASNSIFRIPIEKAVFNTDHIRILNSPLLYRYLTMAWVRSGFTNDEKIDEVKY